MQNAAAFAPANDRLAFIRRVYGIFFSSLLVTVVVGTFAAGMANALFPYFMPILVLNMVLGFIVAFTRRTTGLNVFMLYLFAAVQGLLFGPLLMLANQSAPGVPALAAILTLVTFGSLSMYAVVSGKDFSYLGGFLFMALIGLVVGGIVLMFLHVPMLSLLYSLGGVLIFSGFVLYDTSKILNRHMISEPITAAIALYLDFINLFLFILQLLMNLNRRR
jgi:FtsH-binding integral membrane protein